MKKITGILLIALLVSSCSLFQKPSMSQEQIDAMVAENTALKSQADKSGDKEDELAMVRMQLDEAMLKLAACEEAAMSNVHIIVGAFKNATFAEDYSAQMKDQGYEGRIMSGPYAFHLVSASSHESLKEALGNLASIRSEVMETAWIYFE